MYAVIDDLYPADFTVYDFAHAAPTAIPSKTGRMKKGAANAWCLEGNTVTNM